MGSIPQICLMQFLCPPTVEQQQEPDIHSIRWFFFSLVLLVFTRFLADLFAFKICLVVLMKAATDKYLITDEWYDLSDSSISLKIVKNAIVESSNVCFAEYLIGIDVKLRETVNLMFEKLEKKKKLGIFAQLLDSHCFCLLISFSTRLYWREKVEIETDTVVFDSYYFYFLDFICMFT